MNANGWLARLAGMTAAYRMLYADQPRIVIHTANEKQAQEALEGARIVFEALLKDATNAE